jgi:hypothetical protein
MDLFNIMEAMQQKTYRPKEEYKFLPPVEQLFPFRKDTKIKFFYCPTPEFINETDAKQKTLSDDFYHKTIDKRHHSLQIKSTKPENSVKVSELIDLAQKNYSKCKYVLTDKKIMDSLCLKCKQNNIKMNACLNMILVLCNKMLYEKYEIKRDTISYFNSISLRQFLDEGENERAHKYCYLVSGLPKLFELKSDQTGMDHYVENFWRMAKLESDTFHERIAKKEHFISWKWDECKFSPAEMA